jgi:hypothetical protein
LLCCLVHPSAFSTSDSRNKLLWSWFKLSLLASFYFPVSFLVNCISPSFFILTVSCTRTFLEPLLDSSLQQEEKTVTHIQNDSWWNLATKVCTTNLWRKRVGFTEVWWTRLPSNSASMSWHFMLRIFELDTEKQVCNTLAQCQWVLNNTLCVCAWWWKSWIEIEFRNYFYELVLMEDLTKWRKSWKGNRMKFRDCPWLLLRDG